MKNSASHARKQVLLAPLTAPNAAAAAGTQAAPAALENQNQAAPACRRNQADAALACACRREDPVTDVNDCCCMHRRAARSNPGATAEPSSRRHARAPCPPALPHAQQCRQFQALDSLGPGSRQPRLPASQALNPPRRQRPPAQAAPQVITLPFQAGDVPPQLVVFSCRQHATGRQYGQLSYCPQSGRRPAGEI